MSDFVPGYARSIDELTEAGAITKLRQDAGIIGKPHGNKADPSRNNWAVGAVEYFVKIYESKEKAEQDGARNIVVNKKKKSVVIYDRIKDSEDKVHNAEAAYSEFDSPLSDDEPQAVKDRWALVKEITYLHFIKAQKELDLARFDEIQIIQKQKEMLEEKLKIIKKTHA